MVKLPCVVNTVSNFRVSVENWRITPVVCTFTLLHEKKQKTIPIAAPTNESVKPHPFRKTIWCKGKEQAVKFNSTHSTGLTDFHGVYYLVC